MRPHSGPGDLGETHAVSGSFCGHRGPEERISLAIFDLPSRFRKLWESLAGVTSGDDVDSARGGRPVAPSSPSIIRSPRLIDSPPCARGSTLWI